MVDPGTDKRRRPVFALDDAEADLVSLARAFRRLGVDAELRTFSRSAEMLEAIEAVRGHPAQELPAYVLLDVNLPDMGGLDVLAVLKGRFPALPVVMLSGSARPIDKHRAYCAGAAGFFVKPMGIDRLAELVSTVDRYWQDIVSLPDRLEASS